MSQPSFIHLRVHSAYSLLEGAIHLKDLVKWCVKQGMPAVAVADHGNLFGSLEFSMAASDAGVQPIIACVLFLKPASASQGQPAPKPDQLSVYVQNETGWRNLLKLVSKSYLEPAGHAPLLTWEDLEGYTDGLIAFTGGQYGTLGKHLLSGRAMQAEETLTKLRALFPNRLYIELMRHSMAEERHLEPHFIQLALHHNLPLVATNDAYFIDEAMFEAHDAFLCIAEGTYVGEESRRKLTPDHRLKTPAEMCALFADIPEALANTVRIAKRCAFMAMPHAPMLPKFEIASPSMERSARKA